MTVGDGGFARHEAEQRRRWLELTPLERLPWLERAKRFARLALEASATKNAPGRR